MATIAIANVCIELTDETGKSRFVHLRFYGETPWILHQVCDVGGLLAHAMIDPDVPDSWLLEFYQETPRQLDPSMN